jgi:hypothetical protein
MNRIIKGIFFSILAASLFVACSKDEDPEPTTGTLNGSVVAAQDAAVLAEARVVLFNADNNSPVNVTMITDASGKFTAELEPGNYFVKISKQGYTPVPVAGMEAVPFSITVGVTTDVTYELLPASVDNGGFITGTVTASSAAIAGALVVAENVDLGVGYSSVTDGNGDYAIYNVPAGSYTVKAYIAGYNSSSPAATVAEGIETPEVNVQLEGGASGVLTGTVRNIAAENKDVDVSLVHPLTKETIPGLVTSSVSSAYQIDNIPNGTYIARATYRNDSRVMDPDRIAKFGEPIVVYTSGNTIQLTFDITGSVTLKTPTNAATSVVPVEITSTTPTFEWNAYSSTSDYIIEVIDAATGAVVWGGFDKSGELPVKNIVIPSSQKSIVFNSDGNAQIGALVPGRVYRWRIFASKNDQNSSTGWTLISASEDQVGLFKVVP